MEPGNLVLRHSVIIKKAPFPCCDSEDIACSVAELNAVLWLVARARNRKY